LSRDKTFSLSELASSIQVQLNKIYSGSYWISAEILKLNHYTQSGHCYPQLVEKKEGKIVADLKGFILSSRYKLIRRKFISITQKELGDGMQIRFRCKVGYHPVYGLSLNILDIDPTHTLGEMTRLRNEAIAKLKSENVFDLNKKLKLPLLLRRMAIISVETSKGYGDFNEILDRNRFGRLVKRELFPALVQGDAAVKSISKALHSIQIRKNEFDAVAIIRGGGGETGLDCYDNYSLRKLICEFPLPILTGIGHSTNLTIVEQVANKNLITPSELASSIIKGFEQFSERVSSAIQKLNYLKRTRLESSLFHLQQMKKSLIQSSQRSFRAAQLTLSESANRIAYSVKAILREKMYDLDRHFIVDLQENTLRFNEKKSQALFDIAKKLPEKAQSVLKKQKLEIEHREEKVRILDPVQTLKRGYSITYFKEKPLKNSDLPEKGDVIKTFLSEGELKSKII